MEFTRISNLVIWYIILIQYQVIIVHGAHETFWTKTTCILRNNTLKLRHRFELELSSNILRDRFQMYDPHSKGFIVDCISETIIRRTKVVGKLLPRNITRLGKARYFLSEIEAVTVPNRNMRFRLFSSIYINSYSHNAVIKPSETLGVISRRCFDHFGNLFTLDFIMNGPYSSSETKSGRGILYAWIRYMTNMYDINFRKVSIRDIKHGFILNRLNCVTLPLDTDGFSNGQEHGSKFRLVVTSEEISKHYNRCITDKDNMKNDKCNATDTKDNYENNFAICLTVILFLFYTFGLEGCFQDKFDQDRPVECNGDQNSNGRKENGKARDTIPKEGMIDTTADDSIQGADRPIAGGALEDSLVNEDGNAEYKSSILYENKSNVADREHGARIGSSSNVSNNIRTHGQKNVGQPSVVNEVNGDTQVDHKVKTSDGINTVETVNVGTEKAVSEYITQETAQLELLEATREGGAAQEDELVCKICYMEEISVVFLPCSHMLACESCSKLLERCAVCRAVIKAMLKAEIK